MKHAIQALPKVTRRSLLLGAAALASTRPVLGQEVARLFVGFPPGGPTDQAARLLAPELSAGLGRTMVVENRAGASGSLAIKAIEESAASDKHYALYPTLTAVAPILASGTDPELNRITPISMYYTQYTVITINPEVAGLQNVHNLADLMAVAKAASTPLAYTSSGFGSTGHLMMEWVSNLAGVKMLHVPYRGSMPALTDLLAGHVGVINADSTSVAPHIASGKLRAIAVANPERTHGFPDIPTVVEQGFTEVSAVPWVVLVGPPGMSAEDARAVSDSMHRIAEKPELIRALQERNLIASASSPQATADLMRRDVGIWRKIIVDNKISGQ